MNYSKNNANTKGYRTANHAENLYSKRHRVYGNKLYMLDIDFVEYDSNLKPVAIKEMKHGNIRKIDLNSFQFKLIRNTFTDLPIFCVVYYYVGKDGQLLNEWDSDSWHSHIQYLIIAANNQAFTVLGKTLEKTMSELEWVSLLYSIRSEEMPESIKKELYDTVIEGMNKPEIIIT